MGLDLAAGDHSIRVGSYSGVHIHRRLACMAFLLSDAPQEEKDMVQGWFTDKPTLQDATNELRGAEVGSTMPDYGAMPEHLPEESSDLLRGLWLWVYHSDCDGYHDPTETQCIGRTLTVLTECASKLGDDDTTNWLNRVATFYTDAGNDNLEVTFC